MSFIYQQLHYTFHFCDLIYGNGVEIEKYQTANLFVIFLQGKNRIQKISISFPDFQGMEREKSSDSHAVCLPYPLLISNGVLISRSLSQCACVSVCLSVSVLVQFGEGRHVHTTTTSLIFLGGVTEKRGGCVRNWMFIIVVGKAA